MFIHNKQLLLCLALSLCLGPLACDSKAGKSGHDGPAKSSASVHIAAGEGAAKALQKAFLEAKPGAVIELGAGTIQCSRRLSLDVEKVTVRGQGPKSTVLSFKGQKSGAEGLLVTKGDFTLEGLAIEDTKGDAVKVKGATNVILRKLRVEWTAGPKTSNGAYGLYPVECKNVLIEECHVKCASDAGIYVGQSENIVVRKNHAEMNVAGIEIENSNKADVYDNVATNNTGGVLVFDLPNLPKMGGGQVRVYQNVIANNNHPNFAQKGNIVATVPAGSGLVVMANRQVEVFENHFEKNGTSHISVVSYFASGKELKDKKYNPFPSKIFIYKNKFQEGGGKPSGPVATQLKQVFKERLPDILWDGMIQPGSKDPVVMLNDNKAAKGAVQFANFDLQGLQKGQPKIDTDIKKVQATGQKLPAVQLPFLKS